MGGLLAALARRGRGAPAWRAAGAAALALGRYGRGLLACAVVAVAAMFLAEHYGAPVMLFALLLGMALNFLADEPRCQPGIALASSTVLRLGVALLGMRITLSQLAALGAGTAWLVAAAVALTIAAGMAGARLLGFRLAFGVLAGGAVAICGASAALAIAAAMPGAYPQRERATVFVVIGVSVLSTVAMVAYPMIARAGGLDAVQAGIFLGATIHDVAQVVGAGYGMSQQTGDVATVVKLMRVAMLLPVILLISLLARTRGAAGRVPLLPWFAVAFALLVGVNSSGLLPKTVQLAAGEASRWCLVVAIAAIGLKTRLGEIVAVGFSPVALLVGLSGVLAGGVLLAVNR